MSLKRRKQVRCTMCTHWRWMGNSWHRLRVRDLRKLAEKEVILNDYQRSDGDATGDSGESS